MTTWTPDELSMIGGADELQIASLRPDGTLRPYVTIWAVRAGDDLYIRSAYGSNNTWFRIDPLPAQRQPAALGLSAQLSA